MTDQLPVPSPQDFKHLVMAARLAVGSMPTNQMVAVSLSIHIVATAIDKEDALIAEEKAKAAEVPPADKKD